MGLPGAADRGEKAVPNRENVYNGTADSGGAGQKSSVEMSKREKRRCAR